MRSSIVRPVVLALAAAASWLPVAHAQDQAAADRQPPAEGVKVTISKETTHITEPLRPDGYPDYVRYLDEKLSRGVTPENNATVLLLRALGPRELSVTNADEYYRRLGMEPLPAKGNYYVDWQTFSQRFSAKDWPAPPKGDERNAKEYFESLDDEGRKRPWAKSDFPQLAEWLEANHVRIELMVAASKRPRMYTPLISGEENETLVMVLLPVAQSSREAARALATRAMYRAGNNEIKGALDDLLACRRLARLTGQGFTLVESLVAIAIDGVGLAGQTALVEQEKLPANYRRQLRQHLAQLPPLRAMAQTLDQGERFMYMDSVCWMARDLAGSMEALQGVNEAPGFLQGLVALAAKSAIDWDLILKAGNQWYDRLVKIAALEARKEQLKAMERFDDDVRQLGDSAKSGRLLLQGLIAPRATVSQQMADVLLALLLPAVDASLNAEHRSQANQALLDLGLALADYRDANQRFPERLDQLAPKYIAKVPLDPMRGEPFTYKKTDAGYLLYSFGQNGKDDGGRTFDANDGSDDLVIAVPGKSAKQ